MTPSSTAHKRDGHRDGNRPHRWHRRCRRHRQRCASLELQFGPSISENVGTTSATVSRNTDTANSLTVTLVSNDPGEATVPTTVTIPAGQTTSATFTISGVDDSIVDGTQFLDVTATAAGHGGHAITLQVTDDDMAELTVQIVDASISENGGTTSATVSRNTDTTDALIVTLSSDTGEATVPVTVRIPAGQATSAPFTIYAVDDAIIDGTQIVTVTATAAEHVDGRTRRSHRR